MDEQVKKNRRERRKAKMQAAQQACTAATWLEKHPPIPCVRVRVVEKLGSGMLTEPVCFVAVRGVSA